jgi:hypothetical protein
VISRPQVNSRESPGRKNPMSRPDSAKTTSRRPQIPNRSSMVFGSSQLGPRASVITVPGS